MDTWGYMDGWIYILFRYTRYANTVDGQVHDRNFGAQVGWKDMWLNGYRGIEEKLDGYTIGTLEPNWDGRICG